MMITNNLGLPEAIVSAVRNDPYDAGNCDISVTRLIGPPMIRHLTRLHEAEILEDASDRIWSLMGQSIHAILERAGDTAQREVRLSAEAGGWKISGQLDHFDGLILRDYKVTSVWSARDGAKTEWEQQINCLAWLLRLAGRHVHSAEVVAILRDWRRNERLRYSDYPTCQVQVIPVPLWSQEEAQEYVEARVALHRLEEPPPCTPEERWDRPGSWAVKKPGATKALRVLNTEAEAWAWMDSRDDGHKLELEERKGESVRCKGYCAVAQWCEHGRDLA